jgi:hypothetical protein
LRSAREITEKPNQKSNNMNITCYTLLPWAFLGSIVSLFMEPRRDVAGIDL